MGSLGGKLVLATERGYAVEQVAGGGLKVLNKEGQEIARLIKKDGGWIADGKEAQELGIYTIKLNQPTQI